MWFLIIWLIGFLLSGVWQIVKMSGRDDLGFKTDGTIFMITILFNSCLWFFFIPYWLYLRQKAI